MPVRELLALVCGLSALTVLAAGTRAVVRRARTHRGLEAGLLAQGRVLEVSYLPGDQGRPGVPRSVLTFRTPDGRQFLLVDRSGRAREVEDPVLVRYPADHPEHAVPDDVPRGPVGPAVVALGGAVFVAACLFVAVRVLLGSG